MSNEPKKWGLQLPKSKINIFKSNESDEENDDKKFEDDSGHIDYVKQKMGTNTKVEKTFSKALEDDPTAFEYDSVYDSIKKEKEKKQQQILNRDSKKESRYIASLMEQSLQKKKDYERVKEYKIQKEREKEGDQFKDKEIYVTSAYKKKLEQDRLKKEMEEKEDLEQLNKKKDINSFHKNILSSMYDQQQQQQDKEEKEKIEKEKIILEYKNYNSSNNNNNNNNNNSKDKLNQNQNFKKRYYEPQFINNNENKKEDYKDPYERYNKRRNDEKSIQAARERYFERLSILKN